MAKNVFILGAGASKEAGAPLMAEFLDVARDLLTSGEIQEQRDKEAFQRVFEAIRQFRIMHYKSYMDLDNIEAVFGAFEMARLLKGSVHYSAEQVDSIIASIKRLIAKTLELSMRYPLRQHTIFAAPTYRSFADLILKLGNEDGKYSSSVLTFNYDLGLDLGFYNRGVRVDYGLPNDDDKGTFKLMKLHGSLNWAKCSNEKCNLIIPWHLDTFFQKYGHNPSDLEKKKTMLYIGSMLFNHTHRKCGRNLTAEPVLVPPTWNKTEYHGALREVWAQAGRELTEAENIIVIGYSHPVSDSFFKYLFALGSVGDANIRRFWVFDPAKGNEVESRFRELIGTGIDKRFHMFKEPFSKAISIISNELEKER